jgi:hypothetical protein
MQRRAPSVPPPPQPRGYVNASRGSHELYHPEERDPWHDDESASVPPRLTAQEMAMALRAQASEQQGQYLSDTVSGDQMIDAMRAERLLQRLRTYRESSGQY